MAEVCGTLPQSTIKESYFPTIPPKAPKVSVAYSQALNEAPYTALMGVDPTERTPERLSISPRCRIRNQAGMTNRWRLPHSLYSDLLGNKQAIKAITMPYNTNLINMITGRSKVTADEQREALDDAVQYERQMYDKPESSKLSINREMSKPYLFRLANDRCRSVNSSHGASRRIDSSPMPSSNALKSMQLAGPVRTYTPKAMAVKSPKEIFLYHSKRKLSIVSADNMPGDVVLSCLDMHWELHRPFIQKSETLSELLLNATDSSPHQSYRNSTCESVDNFINNSSYYSNDYREISSRLNKVLRIPAKESTVNKTDKSVSGGRRHSGRKCNMYLTKISLDISDPIVTTRALAIALGNLYHDDIEVDLNDIGSVLAAATILRFKPLVEGCAKIMLKTISFKTVCKYHEAASKYKQQAIVEKCERWLELNLIPQLAIQIQLRELPGDLLQKIIKSNRLFVYNEYSVYKTLTLWMFLQLNPDIQLLPSHSTLLAFFNSLSKSAAFVEKDEGQMFQPLFAAIRFHGILDTGNIQDMQLMNILPLSWLVDLLSTHYLALHGGGDMTPIRTNFNSVAIRQGFIIDEEPHYHSEVISIHGFHFELKAVKEKDGRCAFYMQRLKPNDPVLSFKQSERYTFSMRRDREVRYSITVQHLDEEDETYYTTGVLTKRFSTGDRTSSSDVLYVDKLKKPTYVSFAILFPQS